MTELIFELITPERLVFSEPIYEAIIPTTNGQIAVFPNHTPLISLLASGVISLRKKQSDPDSQLEHVAVSGGFIQVTGTTIKVLADSADKADEVEELKAQEARQKAQELMEKATDDITSADATAELGRAIAQLKLIELKKRRH